MFKKLKSIKYSLFKDKRVALIKLEGIIFDSNTMPIATKVIESIEEVKKQGIKALVFRINSPGGTVGSSQEIFSAIKKLKEDGIKVVASFGDVSASGGVYVSLAADKIVSNPGTVTGSIGVIMKNRILKDLYSKIGIDQETIKSGQFKDIFSQVKYFSDEEKVILQKVVDSTYNLFIQTVAEERNLDIEHVKTFADGRIFTGSQAKEYGLVDEIGSLADAVNLAAKLAEIGDKPDIIELTPKKQFWQKVTGVSLKELFETMGISHICSGIPLWLMPDI